MLETLDDNYSILLLYLSGELPELDRREVERRLHADSGFAAQLEQLRAAQEQINLGLKALDQFESAPNVQSKAADAAIDAVQSWHFGPRKMPPAGRESQRHGMRITRAWLAPGAAAAALLFGALFWTTRHPAVSNRSPVAVTSRPSTQTADDATNGTDLALLQQSFDAGADELSQHARSDFRHELVAKDDLSEYLLKTEVSTQ